MFPEKLKAAGRISQTAKLLGCNPGFQNALSTRHNIHNSPRACSPCCCQPISAGNACSTLEVVLPASSSPSPGARWVVGFLSARLERPDFSPSFLFTWRYTINGQQASWHIPPSHLWSCPFESQNKSPVFPEGTFNPGCAWSCNFGMGELCKQERNTAVALF